MLETSLTKYGGCGFSSPIISKKIFDTLTQLGYAQGNGKIYIPQSNSVEAKEKKRETCLAKYGVEYYSQTLEFHKRARSYYSYNNINFDSSWELAYYIFMLDTGHTIIRHPCKLEYFYNNTRHLYFPDFSVDGELIEIKGSHLLNENNEFINIYNVDDELVKAKYLCAIKNNVKIISLEQINIILDYINLKYGINYLNKFRINTVEVN